MMNQRKMKWWWDVESVVIVGKYFGGVCGWREVEVRVGKVVVNISSVAAGSRNIRGFGLKSFRCSLSSHVECLFRVILDS